MARRAIVVDTAVAAALLLGGLAVGVVGCTRGVAPSRVLTLGTPPSPAMAHPDADLRNVIDRQGEENALLRQRIAEQNESVDVLQHEVRRLQQRESEMQIAIARLSAASEGAGDSPEVVQALAAAEEQQKQVGALQEQLEEERRARQLVESELTRLKEETSTAPLATQVPPNEALAKAEIEIQELRTQLERETAERERLANELAALPVPSEGEAEAPPADEDLQQRLAGLQARHDEIVTSAQRDLAASREREAALEAQLTATQEELVVLRTRASQVAVPVETLQEARAENAELRAQVEQAQEENEALNLKLRTAQRVAELIFRMRAGAAESVPPPQP